MGVPNLSEGDSTSFYEDKLSTRNSLQISNKRSEPFAGAPLRRLATLRRKLAYDDQRPQISAKKPPTKRNEWLAR